MSDPFLYFNIKSVFCACFLCVRSGLTETTRLTRRLTTSLRTKLERSPAIPALLPLSLGYVQNPLSLYYYYELDGSNKHLKKCIAESPPPATHFCCVHLQFVKNRTHGSVLFV